MKYSYNFYQSQLRKDVNSSVFAKPCFEVVHEGVSYQVICKDKKIFGITVVWYQILGIQHQVDENRLQGMKKAIIAQAKGYYKHTRFLIPLYIQFGFIAPLARYAITNYKINPSKQDQETAVAYQDQMNILQGYGLRPSLKHNLPDATVVIAADSERPILREDISKNTREKIKKAEREWNNATITCGLATNISDYDLFYELYAHTGRNKGFGAVTKKQWIKLRDHAMERGYGKLFVVKMGDRVVNGAFCIEDKDTLIYLYGGNDRSVGNKGYSQFLHRRIIQYAHEKGLQWYDMLGASRAGLQDRLSQVTQFKMGFGGYKIEYLGSFDLVLNGVATRIYTLIGNR